MEEGDNPYCAWGEEREKGTIANKPGQHSVHRPPSYLIAISFGKVWRHLKVIKEHTQQCMCMCIVGPWQSLQLLQRDSQMLRILSLGCLKQFAALVSFFKASRVLLSLRLPIVFQSLS